MTMTRYLDRNRTLRLSWAKAAGCQANM